MKTLILYTLLTCPDPIIQNQTNEDWTERDQATLERASKVCFKKYGTCLKYLIKKEDLVYNAICE